ncbi:AAA family ATPase [Candidatus Micrarchaeota archaeon]|nr:AAA family ATPase [Candidatus Micrarchaeota archaeon]
MDQKPKSKKLDLRNLDLFGMGEKKFNQKISSDLSSGERVATGIPGLDELIEGGFVRGNVILVAGDAGTGKSTLAMQYLYNGVTLYGEPGVYLTFEEKKENLFKNMLRYGWDLEKLEEQKKLLILQYPPHDIDRFLLEGEIIEDTIKDMKAKRLVIDSITSFALIFDSEYKRRIGIIKALELFKKWGCTTLLTSEANSLPSGEIRERFKLGYLADGLVRLYNIRQGDERQKAIEIVKMRGIAHSNMIVPFDFKQNGIELYPNQPVFGGLERK